MISSENMESDVIELIDTNRNLFQRSGIDSFILILEK